jgi:hypothetical protein
MFNIKAGNLVLVGILLFSISLTGGYISLAPKEGQASFIKQICHALNKLDASSKKLVILEQTNVRWMIPIRTNCQHGYIVTIRDSQIQMKPISTLVQNNLGVLNQQSVIVISNAAFANSFRINSSEADVESRIYGTPNRVIKTESAVWVGEWKINETFMHVDYFSQLIPKKRIVFSSVYPPDSPLRGGWSNLESWGVWSEGIESVLEFSLPPGSHNHSTLELVGHPQIYGSQQKIKVTVHVNDSFTKSYTLTKDTTRITIPLPIETDPNSRKFKIVLQFSNLKSPKQLGENGDARLLGFGLESLLVF